MIILFKRQKYADKDVFTSIYLSCSIILIPLIMIIQGVVPYERVYSFVGVPTALSVLFCVQMVLRLFRDKFQNIVTIVLSVIGLIILSFNLSSKQYNRSYARREAEILELLRQNNVSKESEFFLTDSYQELLLCFYYGEYREVSNIEEANVLMMPLESIENMDMVGWPIYYSANYFDWEYIEREFSIIYQNDGYLLYQRKE